MKHAMIDVEALRLKQPWLAPLMQVAVVLFDDRGNPIDDSQWFTSHNPLWTSVEPSTLEFWQEQEFWPTMQRLRESVGKDAGIVILEMADYLKTAGVEAVWFAGPTYDQVMLEEYARHYGIEIPWEYNASRDFRTIRKQHPVIYSEMMEKREGHHNALEDARWQVDVLGQISQQHGIEWL